MKLRTMILTVLITLGTAMTLFATPVIDGDTPQITLTGNIKLNTGTTRENTRLHIQTIEKTEKGKWIESKLLPISETYKYKFSAPSNCLCRLELVTVDRNNNMTKIISNKQHVNLTKNTELDIREEEDVTQLKVRVINHTGRYRSLSRFWCGDDEFYELPKAFGEIAHTAVLPLTEGEHWFVTYLDYGSETHLIDDYHVNDICMRSGLNVLTHDMQAGTWTMTYGEEEFALEEEVVEEVDEEGKVEEVVEEIILPKTEASTPEPTTPSKKDKPATGAPSIVVDGKQLPVSAINVDSRVLVPLRAIFEALGAEVNYDDPTKVITSKKEGIEITLTVNKKQAFVNGKLNLLDVPAQIIDSSTYVPTRFIGESLGAQVDWKDNTVFITLD